MWDKLKPKRTADYQYLARMEERNATLRHVQVTVFDHDKWDIQENGRYGFSKAFGDTLRVVVSATTSAAHEIGRIVKVST